MNEEVITYYIIRRNIVQQCSLNLSCIIFGLPINSCVIILNLTTDSINVNFIYRLYLAGMHWNENGGRGQACTSDGTPRIKISYPKPKEGGHVVSRVLTACTYSEYYYQDHNVFFYI